MSVMFVMSVMSEYYIIFIFQKKKKKKKKKKKNFKNELILECESNEKNS